MLNRKLILTLILQLIIFSHVVLHFKDTSLSRFQIFVLYTSFLSTTRFLLPNCYWKGHHWIENQILRSAQSIRGSAHLQRRMSARNTRNPSTNGISGWTTTFRLTTFLESSTIRRRIEFCTQHNWVESRHRSIGEYQQEKLEYAANFTYVMITKSSSSRMSSWLSS